MGTLADNGDCTCTMGVVKLFHEWRGILQEKTGKCGEQFCVVPQTSQSHFGVDDWNSRSKLRVHTLSLFDGAFPDRKINAVLLTFDRAIDLHFAFHRDVECGNSISNFSPGDPQDFCGLALIAIGFLKDTRKQGAFYAIHDCCVEV